MTCNVCSRSLTQRRKGHCASCTQAILHHPRLQQASILIEREKLHSRAEAILRPGNDGVLAALTEDADWDAIAQGIKQHSLQRQQQQRDAAQAGLDVLVDKVAELQQQMTRYRDEIEVRRRANLRREAELQTKRDALAGYRSTQAEILQSAIRKTGHRLQRVHQKSADARAHLCYTASLLAGVRQETNQHRKPTGRIMLGGLVIPDLHELLGTTSPTRTTSPEQASEAKQVQLINACLDNMCRLMATWAHYLSICFPAEIILPHNDFPHAVIYPEKYSYRETDVPYPGNVSSRDGSPTASRIMQEANTTPRPRLLHLDRPLAKIAKEDPKAFGLFLEGITLLAWNLAWLCKTQGITAINTFDELCDVGRNIWLLHRAAETRAAGISAESRSPVSAVHFGVMSHSAVLHSLAGHEGAGLMHNWRLAQPYRLVDKLRSFLLTEMAGAEWDVLSDNDFDAELADEAAVLVGGDRRRRIDGGRPNTAIESVASPANLDLKHDKGWMKIRGRANDTQS